MKWSWMLFVLYALAMSAAAQTPPANAPAQPCCESLEQHMRDLEDRIILLEGQVRLLKQQAAQSPPPSGAQPSQGAESQAAAASPAQTAAAAATTALPSQTLQGAPTASGEGGTTLPVYGGASAAAKALNPDISVIGDFIGASGHSVNSPGSVVRQAGFRSLEMHESEVGFQAIIDPYARGDFFLTFGEEGVGLEEGYITLTALPGGFVARAGKMRAAFGKVNTLHNHVLPWVDRPLVTENLVGGEDGIDDAGVSITKILPAPKGIFLEATGQLFRGDTGTQTYFLPGGGTIDQTLFTASGKGDVSTVAHLRTYKDITDSTNLDLGVSFAHGHNEVGSNFTTNLYGVDATVRWKPLRRSIYHSFVGRSELIWSQREQLPTVVLARLQRSFGMYASADYQLGRRWFVGGRYDWSERARNMLEKDDGVSAVLTYWPSEFSQIRGQYRFTKYAGNFQEHQLLMQVQFSLGAHGAHPF
jgi:hypothetical protein